MFTALRATSLTLANHVRQRLQADPTLSLLFDPGLGGSMVVTLSTPQEMRRTNVEGLSVWLYRVLRDEERLNIPPERIAPDLLRRPPLPVRLHYLLTPLTNVQAVGGPQTEQVVLGKVLQTFHDHPVLRGADLQDDLSGTDAELRVRLESLSLEEITRVWDALNGSYQLSVSYEVSTVNIASNVEPERVSPVLVALPEYGEIVSK